MKRMQDVDSEIKRKGVEGSIEINISEIVLHVFKGLIKGGVK
jgi:hypothetical protein